MSLFFLSTFPFSSNRYYLLRKPEYGEKSTRKVVALTELTSVGKDLNALQIIYHHITKYKMCQKGKAE